MPLPTENFDAGSILGNLWNDIKHIPERTIQQSRQLRVSNQQAAIQAQAQQDAYSRGIVNDAQGLGIDPIKNPDGSVNYMATAVASNKAKDLHDRVLAHLGRTDSTADKVNADADTFGLAHKDATPKNDPAAPTIKAQVMSALSDGLQQAGDVRQEGGQFLQVSRLPVPGGDDSMPAPAPRNNTPDDPDAPEADLSRVGRAIRAVLQGAPRPSAAQDQSADAVSADSAKFGIPQADGTPSPAPVPSVGFSTPPPPLPAPGLPGQNADGATQAPPPQGAAPPSFAPTPAPTGGTLPGSPATTLAFQVMQAQTAAGLAKAKADDQARTDILQNERLNLRSEKDKQDFRSQFSRDPAPGETNPDGTLNAAGLGLMRQANVSNIRGYMPDGNGGMAVIPGGPADVANQMNQQKLDLKTKSDQDKRDGAAQSAAAKQQMMNDTHSALLDNIDTALPQVGRFTSGNTFGTDLMRHIPGIGQGAQDLHSNLDAVKAGLGVDTLNEMRASSSNGSTGIGRVMQVEFEAFSKAARNLDQSQSPAQLTKNLTDLRTHLQNWQAARAKAPAQTQQVAAPAATAAPQPPAGWTVGH